MRRLFIVRKDLHMTAGKLAAQIGHCAEIYWLHIIENSLNYQILTDEYESWDISLDKDIVEGYIKGTITKTVLQARNLNHLMKAKKLAEELGLKEGYDFGFVNDLCLTELTPDEGKDTCTTCFWTRPLPDEIAWKISKKYHLYIDNSGESGKPKRQIGIADGKYKVPSQEEFDAYNDEIIEMFENSKIFPDEEQENGIKQFEEELEKAQQWAAKEGLTEADVDDAIREYRDEVARTRGWIDKEGE